MEACGGALQDGAARLYSFIYASEAHLYADCGILFGRGVPVTILCGQGREVCQLLGRGWARRLAGRWSARLLKEATQPFGRDNQVYKRFTRNVAPGVPRIPGNMNKVASSGADPGVALSVILQSLD